MEAKLPVRVLHIGKYYPPFAGGMENFMGDLLPALAARGIEVAALVHAHDRGRSDDARRADGFAVHRVPCYGRMLYAPVSPQFPFWLARAVRRFQPHVLHLHLPNTSAFWAMATPGARRLPWILQWQSDVVASRVDRRLALAYRAYRPLERALLARARVVVASSRAYLASSAALRPWRGKCRVIPLGLDPARIASPSARHQARAEQLWGGAACKVLAVGRMTYYKGHEHLVQAAARVAGVKVVVVGDGERRERLQRLVNSLAVARQVVLPGQLPEAELAALMATCDCLCLPSVERTEAFGLVLLEAMCQAKATVASDIPGSGVGFVVQDGRTGVLVPPADVPALARALERLAGAPALRASLGQAGKRRLEERFHIRHAAEPLAALYRTVALAQDRAA